MIVTIPGEDTVFDVNYLSIWDASAMQDLGHVVIPDLKAMNVTVPPYVEDTVSVYLI